MKNIFLYLLKTHLLFVFLVQQAEWKSLTCGTCQLFLSS